MIQFLRRTRRVSNAANVLVFSSGPGSISYDDKWSDFFSLLDLADWKLNVWNAGNAYCCIPRVRKYSVYAAEERLCC